MIKLKKVSKYYATKNSVGVGLRKIDLELNINEFVVITGESGSGKSTLLNVLSGQDTYEEGELFLFGEETSHYTITDWENYRADYIGFIFQNYNIIESYTVLQNILLALELQGYPRKERKHRALELIEQVDLSHRIHHKAGKLSGGEKQRTVIARALAKDCPVIVADEPTGNLDSEASKQILKLLYEIGKDKLVVLVTHNFDEVKEYATRRIRIKDGEVVEDRLLKQIAPVEDARIEHTKSRLNTYTIFKSAVRSLFATPRRFIFLLSLQVMVVGIFMFIYAFLMSSADILVSESASPNDSSHQVVIESRNDDPIDVEDFYGNDLIRSISLYETSYNTYLAISLPAEDPIVGDYPLGLITIEDAAVLNYQDLTNGELPLLNEIVVSKAMLDLYDLEVGDEVVLLRQYTRFVKSPGTSYIISGSTLRGTDKTVYLNTEIFIDKEIALEGLILSVGKQIHYYSYNEYGNIEIDGMSFGKVIFDSSLPEGTMIIPSHLLPDPIDLTIVDYDFLIKAYYEQEVFFSVNVNKITRSDDTHFNVIMSTSFQQESIDQLFGDDYIPIRLTLNVHDLADGKKLSEQLDHDKYRVYYNVTSASSKAAILSQKEFEAASYAIVGAVGILLYTILGVVTKNINISRKNDFAIFRSIGANRSFLARQVIIEQIISGLIAFILVLFLLNFVANYNYIISESMRYLYLYHYITLFVISIFLSIQVAGRNNKKIFAFSIISSLNSEVEEIL